MFRSFDPVIPLLRVTLKTNSKDKQTAVHKKAFLAGVITLETVDNLDVGIRGH